MTRRFRTLLLTLVVVAAGVIQATAQDTPDYNVFSTAPLLLPDGETLEMELSVFNGGGDATLAADLTLRVFGQSTIIAQSTVEPLEASQSSAVSLTFPVESLGSSTPGTLAVLEIRLASDEQDTIQRLVEFDVPASGPPPAEPTAAADTPVETTDSDAFSGNTVVDSVREQVEGWLSFLPFEIDLTDRMQLAGLAGITLILLVLLWLLTVILRLMFVPQPTFPTQPPPYANMPQLHPESLGGRRQMWQHVAQHGAMIADESEGNLHVRKVLLGTDGRRFSGWKVIGIRASQYDNYGRVSRTQVIGGRGLARQLSRAIERSEDIQRETARRRVRPVATKLAGQLARRIQRKTAGLPIALDVKLRGEHGEVGIQFLLYQYQLGAWRQLDSWTPEMTVAGKAIYETNTFTIFGKTTEESMRAFRKRLREDMTVLLTEMVLSTPPKIETGIPSRQTAETPQLVRTETATQQGWTWRAPTKTTNSPAPPSEDTVAGKALPAGDDAAMDTVAHPVSEE
jgi:hypothetical protein